jgi:hypothetical protein
VLLTVKAKESLFRLQQSITTCSTLQHYLQLLDTNLSVIHHHKAFHLLR